MDTITIEELIAEGRARLEAEKAVMEQKQAERDAKIRASADAKWAKHDARYKAVLPEALHPFYHSGRPADDPWVTPSEGYGWAIVEVPDCEPFTFAVDQDGKVTFSVMPPEGLSLQREYEGLDWFVNVSCNTYQKGSDLAVTLATARATYLRQQGLEAECDERNQNEWNERREAEECALVYQQQEAESSELVAPQPDTQEMVDHLGGAKEAVKDAVYAWERERDENAQTLALLAIANVLVALVERLDAMATPDALRVYNYKQES